MPAVSMRIDRGARTGSDLGYALRARRLAAGIGEVRLATLLGVRVSEVRVWETGGATPPVSVVEELARILDLEYDEARRWLAWAGAPEEPGPEVAILLVRDDAPADPFSEPSIVIDLDARRVMRAVPPPAIRAARVDVSPPRLRIPPRPTTPPRPAVRPTPAPPPTVFPSPRSETVLYSEADVESVVAVRRTARRRRLILALALGALGLLLWWAFGQLGNGFSSVVERLGSARAVLGG